MFDIIWIKRHWKIYLQDFIPCVILQISMNQNQSSSVRGNKRQRIKCFLTTTKMLICHTKLVVVPRKGMVYYISKWHALREHCTFCSMTNYCKSFFLNINHSLCHQFRYFQYSKDEWIQLRYNIFIHFNICF